MIFFCNFLQVTFADDCQFSSGKEVLDAQYDINLNDVSGGAVITEACRLELDILETGI